MGSLKHGGCNHNAAVVCTQHLRPLPYTAHINPIPPTVV